MTVSKIPPKTELIDKQVVTIAGCDGLTQTYQFNAETCTLIGRETQIIIPSQHGVTHIGPDPVPNATTDSPGLMAQDDKAKLDAITQTRLGVLGFAGAGFPDDGGFLQGDIILAAGTESISLERIGNVIRFTLNLPQQFCGCEECAQIFWIQDESDTDSIRPPSCNGKLPGVNSYGELKVFLLPESTILNPADPVATLNQKVNFPALIFKRFDDSITPGQGEYELILARNANGTTNVGWAMTPGANGTAECAWFMGSDDDGNQIRFDLLPNAEPDLLGAVLYKGHTLTRQMGVVTGFSENILATNLYEIKFWDVLNAQPIGDEFEATNVWRYTNPENSPTDLVDPRRLVLDATKDLLPVGTLVQLWEFQIGEINGERLTRRFFNLDPGLKADALWNLAGSIRFGDLLTARLETSPGGTGEKVASETVSDIRLFEHDEWGITGFEDPLLFSDDGQATNSSEAVLGTGAVFQILDQNPGLPEPNHTILLSASTTNPTAFFVDNEFAGKTLKFTTGGLAGTEFEILTNSENTITVFGELICTDGSTPSAAAGDNFVIFGEVATGDPSGVPANNQFVADVDPTLPGLRIAKTDPQIDSERPVYLWHRQNHGNLYLKALIGQPDNSTFPPIDILLRAPVDSFDDRYVKIIKRGQFDNGPFAGRHWIVVHGLHWRDLPQRGVLRTLTGLTRNEIWRFDTKLAFPPQDDDGVILVSEDNVSFLFDDDFGLGTTGVTATTVTIPTKTTVAELLHQEYTSPAVRIEFSVIDQTDAESVQMQVRAGILDMSEPYEFDVTAGRLDDLVRGFRPGSQAVSKVNTQQGFITSIETPKSDPEGFRVFTGGFLPTTIEGETERWNELEIMYRGSQIWVWWNRLLIPPDPTESAALSPPVVVNTPYFTATSDAPIGKVAFRLWPGTTMRSAEIRDQLIQFNEFTNGQLQLV